MDLESLLKTIETIVPMLFSDLHHAVVAQYDKKKQKWIYVDTNLLHVGEKSHYIETDSPGLIFYLWKSLNRPKLSESETLSYLVFNAMALAQNMKPTEQLLFDSLQLKHFDPSKQAYRYNQRSEGLLHLACLEGQDNIVERLLQQSEIAVNEATESGDTALYIACQNGRLSIVERLLQHSEIEINKANKDGVLPLRVASYNGHVIVEKLIKQRVTEINKANKSAKVPFYITWKLLFANMLLALVGMGVLAIAIKNIRALNVSESYARSECLFSNKTSVFFTLTGIGILVVAIKRISAINISDSYSLNDCLLFSKTNKEQRRSDLMEVAPEVLSVS